MVFLSVLFSCVVFELAENVSARSELADLTSLILNPETHREAATNLKLDFKNQYSIKLTPKGLRTTIIRLFVLLSNYH